MVPFALWIDLVFIKKEEEGFHGLTIMSEQWIYHFFKKKILFREQVVTWPVQNEMIHSQKKAIKVNS